MNIIPKSVSRVLNASSDAVVETIEVVGIAASMAKAEVSAMQVAQGHRLTAEAKINANIAPLIAEANATKEAMEALLEAGLSQEEAKELLANI